MLVGVLSGMLLGKPYGIETKSIKLIMKILLVFDVIEIHNEIFVFSKSLKIIMAYKWLLQKSLKFMME